jgi:hypothetical protein
MACAAPSASRRPTGALGGELLGSRIMGVRGGTRRWAGVALAVLFATTACSSSPSPGEASGPSGGSASATATSRPSGSPALTTADVTATVADYDARNNAALVAAGRDFDPGAWTGVDGGALLESDVFATRLARAQAEADHQAKTITHENARAYLPDVDPARPWLLVTATSQGTSEVLVLGRTEPSGPWVGLGQSTVEGPLAEAAAPGGDSTADEALTGRVRTALAAVVGHVSSPQEGSVPFVGPASTHHARLDRERSGLGAKSFTSTAQFHTGGLAEQGTGGGSTWVVKAADGSALVLSQLRNHVEFSAGPGSTIEHGPDFAEVTGETGPRPSLAYDFLLTVVLRVTASGEATMLGSSLGNLPVR